MRRDSSLFSEVAIFVAGAVAAGWLANRRADRPFPVPAAAPPAEPAAPAPTAPPAQDLRRAISDLESRLAGHEAVTASRFGQLESRVEEISGKLAEMPSTQQIVSAMEQLLSKTMSSLDDRLSTQAHSIEILKTTVTQTDTLLERVLESLDSLQSYSEPLDPAEDAALHREAV
jgi:hypothetical protein